MTPATPPQPPALPQLPQRALVLFSGGQDSTTCLAWALERYAHVETIGFDYGQKHRIELDARQVVLNALRRDFAHWATRLGPDHLLDLPVLRRDLAAWLQGEANVRLHGTTYTGMEPRSLA